MINDINQNNGWGKQITSTCNIHNLHHAKHIVPILRAERACNARIEAASNEYLIKQSSKLNEHRNAKRAVHETLRAILHDANAAPLSAATRKTKGPNGEEPGSVTMQRIEFDKTTTQKWQGICKCNAGHQEELVDNCMAKYDERNFHAKDISKSTNSMRRTCNNNA